MELTEYGKKRFKRYELEDVYKKMFSDSETETFMIYPSFWFSMDDDEFKIRILEQAIRENKNIKELEEIQKLSRMIKNSKLNTNIQNSLKR